MAINCCRSARFSAVLLWYFTSVTACFCTRAFHEPYRTHARLICADAATAPFVVLTDEPGDRSMDYDGGRH
jgi:hypothetical protein